MGAKLSMAATERKATTAESRKDDQGKEMTALLTAAAEKGRGLLFSFKVEIQIHTGGYSCAIVLRSRVKFKQANGL